MLVKIITAKMGKQPSETFHLKQGVFFGEQRLAAKWIPHY
jgi:hypothetical protein